MKVFAAMIAATSGADSGCIFAPVIATSSAPTSKAAGPIWKQMSCDQDEFISEDGKNYMIPVGAKCVKAMCNIKTGGNVAKYREFSCVADNKLEVMDWWKRTFTFLASPENFLCPSVRYGGCPWNSGNGKFVMPNAADQVAQSIVNAEDNNLDVCNRQAYLGSDQKNFSAKTANAMVDPNGLKYFFNKKKFDAICDKFIPDKKIPGLFSKKANQKSGLRLTCKCGKASGSQIKAMFTSIIGETVSEVSWTDVNCEWDGTHKGFSPGAYPYDFGTKGKCDHGKFVSNNNGKYTELKQTGCCQMTDCGDNSDCFEFMPGMLPGQETNPFWGSGFSCSCVAGYKFNDEGVCVQADPCLQNNGGCSEKATCTTTYAEDGTGTANCSCQDGYNGDGIICTPNDCTVDNGGCDENADCAQAEDGTFSCSCKTDEFYEGDGQTCSWNPCALGACHESADCLQLGDSYECTCWPGWVGEGDHCDHMCTVNNGGCALEASCIPLEKGLECSCDNGFEGDGKSCSCPADKGVVEVNGVAGCYNDHPLIDCGDNQIWSWSDNMCACIENSEKNTDGLCVCSSGYAGTGASCDDIDECLNPESCTMPNTDCINHSGGFTCPCTSGYELTNSSDDLALPTCTDIDECVSLSLPSSVQCTNVDGSHIISCAVGFTASNGTDISTEGCSNIDECTDGIDQCGCDNESVACSSTCADTEGGFPGYTCSCSSGFELLADGVTCTDVNECLSDPCELGEACVNLEGSVECTCPDGFEIEGNGITCDECKFEFDNCDENADCFDLTFGYQCSCQNGYSDAYEGANGTACVQDGDWAPLPVKGFKDGLSDAIRSGVQNEFERTSQWPELPDDFGCASPSWNRDFLGYIEAFNDKIKQNKKLYKGPNKNDADWEDQVKFPPSAAPWSWGTWGEWGEWTNTCTRSLAVCDFGVKGWQTRERFCFVDGVQTCSTRCLPVDDQGRTPMESDKKKYPFTLRVDRVNEENKDLWWVDPKTGKKVKSYKFEEPFNPYYEGNTNALMNAHIAAYDECRETGSFIAHDLPSPLLKDSNGEWIKNWSTAPAHPVDYLDKYKKRADGERYTCTHQFRKCADVAEWVHDAADGTVVSGWSEWSECFAQKQETKCMPSGHINGNFAAPWILSTHHYQQRTRRCSTGCFADCIVTKDDWIKKGHDANEIFVAWSKIGDQDPDSQGGSQWAQRGAVMWRACHHHMESFGCDTSVFGGFKSHVSLGSKCTTPISGVRFTPKGFTQVQSGLLKAGTTCEAVYSSMNSIPKAPFWDTTSKPSSDKKVDLFCHCKPGCNKCEWQVSSPQNVLGVSDVIPPVSNLNGFLRDYSFAPAVKHKWDTSWPKVQSKAVRFWNSGEFPDLQNTDDEGDYICISSKGRSTKQFGYMFDSTYHHALYPPNDNEWYNWNQFMCRYALRFGTWYEYFTETDFQIFQVEDPDSIVWAEANDFLVGEYDPSQIVTAGDNDLADNSGAPIISYDGELSNWRINGACRIVLKCTSQMVKQYEKGKSTIPCIQVDQVYHVRPGSLRMYQSGTYSDGTNPATVPKFCCKEAQYLHYAEPHLFGADNVFDEGARTVSEYNTDTDRSLTPAQELLAQSPNKKDQERFIQILDEVVDDAKRQCNNHYIQILTVKNKHTMTQWSAWSECSVSCGTLKEDGTYEGGFQERKRVPIKQAFVEGLGLMEKKYVNNEVETETKVCHDYKCHTTHWGEWADWGGCSKNKNKPSEKWQKRKRVCMWNGSPLADWKALNKKSKTKTNEDVNCPKSDAEEWRCCCNENNCKKGAKSLCPWEPSFAEFKP